MSLILQEKWKIWSTLLKAKLSILMALSKKLCLWTVAGSGCWQIRRIFQVFIATWCALHFMSGAKRHNFHNGLWKNQLIFVEAEEVLSKPFLSLLQKNCLTVPLIRSTLGLFLSVDSTFCFWINLLRLITPHFWKCSDVKLIRGCFTFNSLFRQASVSLRVAASSPRQRRNGETERGSSLAPSLPRWGEGAATHRLASVCLSPALSPSLTLTPNQA